jgi:hypothetical protein
MQVCAALGETGRRETMSDGILRTLTIPVKGVYFDEIRDGRKLVEYRLRTDFWVKRLRMREYDQIVLTRGYPKGGGIEGVTRLTREWRGFTCGTICHPHFGPEAVDVYNIDVSTPATPERTNHDN